MGSLATTSKPGGHLVICLDLAGQVHDHANYPDRPLWVYEYSEQID